MFLILFSEMLFANFTDTAFIKRFGVEYLPHMFVIDAVLVFFVMDMIRGLAGRYTATTLLTRIFVIFTLIEILCRILILFDLRYLYPVMYILRQQFNGVMLVVFWNICNDLFDTRQSKRLFPLITAAGILGRILGSFSTAPLSRVTAPDNLLLVSAGLLVMGALATRRIGRLFPPPIALPGTRDSKGKGWSSPIAGFREMSVLAKGSLLFVLLAAIRILPNVAGPMFDFQYSVILDKSFASEGGLIQFYATIRGVLSIIAFVVLLFVGKVYTRVGIPNALLFRPANYFLVFSLLLFRSDILVGIYGRISISVLTTTMHNPANHIMINLFPDKVRAKIRPILQVAARAGSLLGSLILLGLETFIQASYFSIFGLFFVALWILVTLRLKKNYSTFLLETVLEKQVDLRELEEIDFTVLVQDSETLNRLLRGLDEEKGAAAALCARILAEARYPALGEAILSALPSKDPAVQIELLDLLRPEDRPAVVPALVQIAETAPPRLRPYLVGTVGRLAPKENLDFLRRMASTDQETVQAEAVVGLFHAGMAKEASPLLMKWLESRNPEDLLLGIRTAARTGDRGLDTHLYAILEREKDSAAQAEALDALGLLDVPGRDQRIMPWLQDPNPAVRRAAVSALALESEKSLQGAIQMLGDESTDVREAAFHRIVQVGKAAVPFLLRSLNSPKRDLKDGILRLLGELDVKDVELSGFITGEMHSVCENLRSIEQIRDLEETPALGLLVRHLEDENDDAFFTIFRILEVQGGGNKMRTIYRGVRAGGREKANALEALEDALHPGLSRVL
ncbi:MAG: HEAT repeat domain-containing protein, partial [Deltaproteobacteria bacterium]|nr:HEAT repeat domain-containing protein [Deltaproteobacteria bacterium]